MFKAFVLAMLVISCVAAFPTGESISKTLGVTGKNMATCIASKKVTGVVASAKAAAVAAWGKVTSMFGRRLGAIAAVKGAAKKVALVACNTAGNAIVQKAGQKSAGAMWGADSQACAKQLVGDACQKKVTSVLGRRLMSGADMAKALGFKGAEMAACIAKRKVSAATKAAGAAWAKVTSIFGRRLGAIAAVKGAAKKVALVACNTAGNAIVQKAGKKSAGAMWGADSQACAKQLVGDACQKKVTSVLGRRLVSGADMAKALGFKGAEMAKCILARKVSAASKAAGAAWAKVTSIFGRRLGAIAAVKGAAKKVALAACKKAANAVVQKIGSKAAGTMWGKDSQLCAQELTAASCETKVGAVFKL